MGCKTTSLVLLDILLPFILTPEALAESHIVIKVNNVARFYAWENKNVKNDNITFIVIRSIVLVSANLGSVFLYME